MRTSLVATLLAIGTVTAAAGCGDDHGHGAAGGGGTGDDHHAGDNACGKVENCMDTVDLEEGLSVDGENGLFTLTIDGHNTLAPKDNEWMVTLSDAAGDPAANVTLTVDVWSVDCMHGGPLPPEKLTTDADGKATLTPVTAHGGPWDVNVEAKSGATTDTIQVHLCIPGEDHSEGTEHHGDSDASHDMEHAG
jgi:hypothetical protein